MDDTESIEALKAEILTLRNCLYRLSEENSKFTEVLDKLLYYAEESNGHHYGGVSASLIENLIKDVYWK